MRLHPVGETLPALRASQGSPRLPSRPSHEPIAALSWNDADQGSAAFNAEPQRTLRSAENRLLLDFPIAWLRVFPSAPLCVLCGSAFKLNRTHLHGFVPYRFTARQPRSQGLLVLGAWSFFGTWSLGFGAFPPSSGHRKHRSIRNPIVTIQPCVRHGADSASCR
jgi:hypothetical protein